MNIAPRDYAPRRNAERDVLRNRIRKLEMLRNALLTVVGLLSIALAFAFAWTA